MIRKSVAAVTPALGCTAYGTTCNPAGSRPASAHVVRSTGKAVDDLAQAIEDCGRAVLDGDGDGDTDSSESTRPPTN